MVPVLGFRSTMPRLRTHQPLPLRYCKRCKKQKYSEKENIQCDRDNDNDHGHDHNHDHDHDCDRDVTVTVAVTVTVTMTVTVTVTVTVACVPPTRLAGRLLRDGRQESR